MVHYGPLENCTCMYGEHICGPYIGPYLAALFCSVGCPILQCGLPYFLLWAALFSQCGLGLAMREDPLLLCFS